VAIWLSDNGVDHKTKVTLNRAQLVLRYGLPFATSKANKLEKSSLVKNARQQTGTEKEISRSRKHCTQLRRYISGETG